MDEQELRRWAVERALQLIGRLDGPYSAEDVVEMAEKIRRWVGVKEGRDEPERI